MILLGLDVGTTNCKAGLFNGEGAMLKLATRPTVTHKTAEGLAYYDPEELWRTVTEMLREIADSAAAEGTAVSAVGIASMSEAGLLVHRKTGRPRTHIIPWFDRRSMKQYETIRDQGNNYDMFCLTGLHGSFKYGLAKLLWLEQHEPGITDGCVWLSVADYIAFRLTGQFGTDYSLALRTYAFRADTKEWNAEWIRHFGLSPELFPPARPSGTPVGLVPTDDYRSIGIRKGTPVAVSGHDHLCASLAAGAYKPGMVFDSMGTAETLVGALEERTLGRSEYKSGLSYGCHVAKGRFFWMGGLSASGASVEWLRTQLGASSLTYEEMDELLEQAPQPPGSLLYFPYLTGSGAPMPDPSAKAAFVGLTIGHTRSDMLKAVLEGTAYEMESIRRAAQSVTGSDLNRIIAVGGGTRNSRWMQIKSDVSNCRFDVPDLEEATSFGAALVAAVGCGLYADEEQAVASLLPRNEQTFHPDEQRHRRYARIYEEGFLRLQSPLRQWYSIVNGLF